MNNVINNESVIATSVRILIRYSVACWRFDKGFDSKINKELLHLEIPQVIIPKKGKCTKAELEEEKKASFVKLRHQHSAIESNINELENRGLNKCPDKGYAHFKRYIGIGICAYNLHKIGAQIMRVKKATQKESKLAA